MKHPAAAVALLIAVLAWGSPAAGAGTALELPNIGESTEAFLSTEDEQVYGELFMRSIRHSLPLVEDPEVEDYLEALGNRLAANAGARDRRFTFFGVRDATVNAFAGPGGYIGINTGLILTSDSEAELASVFAHEIAHVTQRHLARAFEEASRMSMPMTAALIAALILGTSSGSGQATEAAIAATAAGSIQQQINFTRAHEQEADRVGLRILADAGYEPRAMPRFFERLHQSSRFYDNLQLEFLRTHPMTSSRIADTGARADQYPRLSEAVTDGFPFIRERVRVLQTGDAEKSIAWYRAVLEDADESRQAPLRYGFALALTAAGRHAEAREQLAPLLASDPERALFQMAAAQIARHEGRIEDALAIQGQMLAIYPHHLPLTVYQIETLLDARRPEEAVQLISDYLGARSPRPILYRLLANAREVLGDAAAAHQALGEYHALRAEIAAAIEQFRIALARLPAEDARTERIRGRMDRLHERWRAHARLTGEDRPPERSRGSRRLIP